MKRLAITAVLLALCLPCLAAESWLRGLPASWPNGNQPKELPPNTYAEVPVSMFETAEEQLRKHAVVKLPDDGAESFRRKDLLCSNGSRPYLVRAVYTNGSTGGYSLNRIGNILWVSHESLGQSTGVHRSALVACLPFEPVEVYVTASGAM